MLGSCPANQRQVSETQGSPVSSCKQKNNYNELSRIIIHVKPSAYIYSVQPFGDCAFTHGAAGFVLFGFVQKFHHAKSGRKRELKS